MEELQRVTAQKGLKNLFRTATDDPEVNTEGLELPADLKELPFQMNWSAELPSEFCVPTVNLHSLILDFSAVSFLDISAMKGLKMALKEFTHVDVDVYIVSCDALIMEKLHSCMFFDEIWTSMFFPTLHDAMLDVLEKQRQQHWQCVERHQTVEEQPGKSTHGKTTQE